MASGFALQRKTSKERIGECETSRCARAVAAAEAIADPGTEHPLALLEDGLQGPSSLAAVP